MNEARLSKNDSGQEQTVANRLWEQKILAKIKTDKLTPKPRWQFLLKNYVVWIFGAAALLIGAAAISVMIYLFIYNDWNLYEQTHKSFMEFFLLTLPYFWIIFLGLFIFIIYYNLKHTKRGYRYPLYLVILAPVAASLILGFSLYYLGVGEQIDDVLGRQAPFYDRFINRHVGFWSDPDEGRLIGLVVSPLDNNKFILVDRSGEEWLVSISRLPDRAASLVILGQPVKLLGQRETAAEFEADRILPMTPPGHGFFDRFDSHFQSPQPPRPPRLPYQQGGPGEF
ncbi:MAG: hypothetical protein WC523_06860 [Patescibacteria group bacterium]|jgi:heme/copper-type cytochrome/quinol oxidase subunit 2